MILQKFQKLLAPFNTRTANIQLYSDKNHVKNAFQSVIC